MCVSTEQALSRPSVCRFEFGKLPVRGSWLGAAKLYLLFMSRAVTPYWSRASRATSLGAVPSPTSTPPGTNKSGDSRKIMLIIINSLAGRKFSRWCVVSVSPLSRELGWQILTPLIWCLSSLEQYKNSPRDFYPLTLWRFDWTLHMWRGCVCVVSVIARNKMSGTSHVTHDDWLEGVCVCVCFVCFHQIEKGSPLCWSHTCFGG